VLLWLGLSAADRSATAILRGAQECLDEQRRLYEVHEHSVAGEREKLRRLEEMQKWLPDEMQQKAWR
jgi:hypothetical protein